MIKPLFIQNQEVNQRTPQMSNKPSHRGLEAISQFQVNCVLNNQQIKTSEGMFQCSKRRAYSIQNQEVNLMNSYNIKTNLYLRICDRLTSFGLKNFTKLQISAKKSRFHSKYRSQSNDLFKFQKKPSPTGHLKAIIGPTQNKRCTTLLVQNLSSNFHNQGTPQTSK